MSLVCLVTAVRKETNTAWPQGLPKPLGQSPVIFRWGHRSLGGGRQEILFYTPTLSISGSIYSRLQKLWHSLDVKGSPMLPHYSGGSLVGVSFTSDKIT